MSEKPKLTYCFNCKKDTKTVLKRSPKPIQGLLNMKQRYCKECAKLKEATEIEMEE